MKTQIRSRARISVRGGRCAYFAGAVYLDDSRARGFLAGEIRAAIAEPPKASDGPRFRSGFPGSAGIDMVGWAGDAGVSPWVCPGCRSAAGVGEFGASGACTRILVAAILGTACAFLRERRSVGKGGAEEEAFAPTSAPANAYRCSESLNELLDEWAAVFTDDEFATPSVYIPATPSINLVPEALLDCCMTRA